MKGFKKGSLMTTTIRAAFCLLCVLVVLDFTLPVSIGSPAADGGEPDVHQIFTKMDMMIPMRDGVKLYTEIYVPKNTMVPLPFILERTPYGLNDDSQGYSRKLGIYQELIRQG
jgi:uncharacterized protein